MCEKLLPNVKCQDLQNQYRYNALSLELNKYMLQVDFITGDLE